MNRTLRKRRQRGRFPGVNELNSARERVANVQARLERYYFRVYFRAARFYCLNCARGIQVARVLISNFA